MAESKIKPSKEPVTLAVMRQDARRLFAWARDTLEAALEKAFAITRKSAWGRIMGLTLTGSLLWSWFAFRSHPIDALRLSYPETLLYGIAKAYFSADVLRHVIISFLAYWLAYRLAAVYLDDIFELENPAVGASFISQAAFASRYNRITIKNGAVASKDRKSPIYMIGGPGLVRVQLENAALFEKIDGTPHVIGPSKSLVPLEGFERLRTVIDLRDQVIESLEVKGRTKDGIPITAKEINVVYSVYRGLTNRQKRDRQSLANPYPFAEEAIKNLVYKQSKRPWTRTVRSNIQSRLRKFIAQHTLNEFLANISSQELAEIDRYSAPFDAQFSRQKAAMERFDRSKVHDPEFVPRNEITDLFYDFAQGSSAQAASRGYELKWIGIGTWVPPDIIPKKHLIAWMKSEENRLSGSKRVLRRLRRNSRIKELIRLIQDVPLNAFGTYLSQGKDPRDIKRELLLTYREKLRKAHEYYIQNQVEPPAELVATLLHLNRLTTHWI